jgi:hypothetical protein
MERLDIPQTRPRFEHLFREYGLPQRISPLKVLGFSAPLGEEPRGR